MQKKLKLIVIILFMSSIGSSLTITLDKAIDRAIEYNEELLTAKDVVNQAKAGVISARAGFLPKISAQISYTKLAKAPALDMPFTVLEPVIDSTGTWFKIVGFDVMEFQMGENKNYLGRATLQQPLFTWGKILNGYQISKLNVDASKENYRKKENELVFNVTKSFYGILILEKFTKLTEEAYKQTERHIEIIEKRYNEGLASKFDLLRGKVQLANMKPQVIKVKNGLKIANTGFKMLLGLPQDTPIELKGELQYEGTVRETPLQKCIADAKANRPEIKSLFFRKQMAKKALTIAKKSNLPNLAFVGNYDYKKPLYFKNEWGTDWNVTVALQMPIFTGLENFGKLRQAKYQLSQVEHGLNLLKEGIEMEVKVTYLQLEEAKKLVESQEENIAQAKEALEIVEERYKTGIATSLEVMDTQLALTKARTNWLQSLSDCFIAKAKLEKVIGK